MTAPTGAPRAHHGVPAADVGLTEQQATQIRDETGSNELPHDPGPTIGRRFASQLRDPMILLLLGAAALTVLLRDLTDLIVITAVVVLNSLVGVAQEVRAAHALSALQAISAPSTRVWRDGTVVQRPSSQIVPGDVIVLEAGDIVPADGSLVEEADLAVDEAAMTGESDAVAKVTGETVLAGTVVTHGRGTAVVRATGADSALGRIAAMVGQGRSPLTPLQRRLRQLGRVLAATAVLLSLVVMAVGVLRGRPLQEMVLTAVSLAVAAVPESLPAVVTLALALGAWRMARASAIVRSLPAVETLGSVTVLATDKTGTLTEGRMSVTSVVLEDGQHGPVVAGFDVAAEDPTSVGWPRLLRDIVLCNDAALLAPDQDHPYPWTHGDGTEVALVEAASRDGLDPPEVRAGYPRMSELPFDSHRRRMTTVHASSSAEPAGYLVVCKGAPEALLESPGLLADRVARRPWQDAAARLTSQGMRVLAVAEGHTDQPDAEAAERGLELIGLLGITDPPRADAEAAIGAVRTAGIGVVMITGDHPDTARAIASRLGLPSQTVVTGSDLDLQRLPDAASVIFARTRPEQKLDIVAALQERGDVVAMTGDGVNDAPALRSADIGVAMGRTGTEVAKQAADLVLTDDSLETLVVAVSEGRRIYSNIRTFLCYAMAGGLAEILVMLLGPAVGLEVPLLPAQILWINLLTHGLPGVAFGAEPGDARAMSRPPRSPQESVLGRGLTNRVIAYGALIGFVTLLAGWWQADRPGMAQSTVFLTLGLAQLGIAVALRRRRARPWHLGFLDAAVASAVVLQLAGVYAPALQDLLSTYSIDRSVLPGILALAAAPGFVVAVTRRLRHLRAQPAESAQA